MKTHGRNKEGRFFFMHYFVIEHYVIDIDLWWLYILILTEDNSPYPLLVKQSALNRKKSVLIRAGDCNM